MRDVTHRIAAPRVGLNHSRVADQSRRLSLSRTAALERLGDGERIRRSLSRIGSADGGAPPRQSAKCVIARWLAGRPANIILDEPTKGIDVAAMAEIHRLIGKLAAAGSSVLLISSDLPELAALSRRILVMHKGRLVGGPERAQFHSTTIVRMASTGIAA